MMSITHEALRFCIVFVTIVVRGSLLCAFDRWARTTFVSLALFACGGPQSYHSRASSCHGHTLRDLRVRHQDVLLLLRDSQG